MERTKRFYKIDHLLNDLRCTSMSILMEELGGYRAMVKHGIEYLRDRFRAPIV